MGQWKQINYLNLYIPFPHIKIFITHFITPSLFPIELWGNLRPESSRILNGSIIHLQILIDHKSYTHITKRLKKKELQNLVQRLEPRKKKTIFFFIYVNKSKSSNPRKHSWSCDQIQNFNTDQCKYSETCSGDWTLAWPAKSSLGRTKSSSSVARDSPSITAFRCEMWPAPDGRSFIDSTWRRKLLVLRLEAMIMEFFLFLLLLQFQNREVEEQGLFRVGSNAIGWRGSQGTPPRWTETELWDRGIILT